MELLIGLIAGYVAGLGFAYFFLAPVKSEALKLESAAVNEAKAVNSKVQSVASDIAKKL